MGIIEMLGWIIWSVVGATTVWISCMDSDIEGKVFIGK